MVKLNVIERLTVLELLPRVGDFATLRLIRDAIAKIGLSADERTEYELKFDAITNITSWNEKGRAEKEIDLKEKEADLIKDALSKKNDEKKLEQKHFSIYGKFIEVK